ncbi:hypothetical protein [Brevundimonas naejangsanensis]|uniref:hypothetical protein n=1 Tax=Brevundimonas naejangsanensis TaxID=588932 RepID=UPI0034D6F7CA
MSLQPVLTDIGRDALIAAQIGQGQVIISKVALGKAPRLPTGHETGVIDPFLVWPISTSTFVEGGQIDLGVLIEGSQTDLTEDQPVREIAFLDADDRPIFYWATTGALGSVTPATAYALTFSVVLAPADAAVIQIIDQGAPWEVLFGARVAALEAKFTSPASPLNRDLAVLKDAAWRNFFLSQA